MSIVIIMPNRPADARRLAEDLRDQRSAPDIRLWPDCGEDDAVEIVVSWMHPAGALQRFRNLRMLVSFGAGVDHLLGDRSIPAGVPVVRTVAEGLAGDIAEYVVASIAHHRRHGADYARDQCAHRWKPRPYPRECIVLVLGAGRMGLATARTLATLGFGVRVWRRSGVGNIEGLDCLAGRAALDEALPGADAVVCLLPLTPATEDLLDARFFARMKSGSLLVNVARGRHLVERDLLEALDLGRPGGAVLDVVRTEPLPPDHPFWDHPGITLTPHVAALTDPAAAADHIAENLRRLEAGETLLDVVDLGRGY